MKQTSDELARFSYPARRALAFLSDVPPTACADILTAKGDQNEGRAPIWGVIVGALYTLGSKGLALWEEKVVIMK